MIHRMCRDIMRRFSGSGSAWRSGSRRGVQERSAVCMRIGCGSGVNLYLFSTLKHVAVLGGLDYSKNLIRIAQSVVTEADVGCEEARRVPTEPKYDVVLADSVFQYFNDAAYGQKVLERMWAKAGKMVVVTEVHDQEKKDEHMAYRRKCVENYDEVYAGLDKTFYTREMFLQFAEEHDQM